MATPSETLTAFNIEQGERKRAAQMLNYVIAESGCWIWQGTKFKDGYGKVGRYGKTDRTHRVFYVEHVGEIPEGLQVLHKCDTPLCVNPEHLFLGTCLDNMRDKHAKGRQAPNPALAYPERLKRGDDNHMRQEAYRALKRGVPPTNKRLSAADVTAIAATVGDTAKVAANYGITSSYVTLIRRGYRHITK